jgi:hypothetical protein
MKTRQRSLFWQQRNVLTCCVIVGLMLGGLATSGCNGSNASPSPQQQQWEYKVGWVVIDSTWDLDAEAQNLEDLLNSKYGADGWELVGVLSVAISENEIRESDGTAFVAYKRPKR